MTNTEIGLIGLGALFVLFVLRMPVGLTMLIVGCLEMRQSRAGPMHCRR